MANSLASYLRDEIGWRSTKSNFDLVALAVESGQDILDGEDVTALLSNQTSLQATVQSSNVKMLKILQLD